jgi:hypothetical protein
MKAVISSFLIILFFSFQGVVRSQQLNNPDVVYGPDQTLYNGKKYLYRPPPGTTGNQYLVSQLFFPGSVTLQGKTYRDLVLNYDVFNQQLLLQYADEHDPLNVIELSKSWLTHFTLDSLHFEYLRLDQGPQFYQVLGSGAVRVLYFWRKSMNLNDRIGTTNYVFSKPVRDAYILKDGKLRYFNSRSSLVRIFDKAQRAGIKNYLRKNKVRVNSASDKVMTDMINFIGKQQ